MSFVFTWIAVKSEVGAGVAMEMAGVLSACYAKDLENVPKSPVDIVTDCNPSPWEASTGDPRANWLPRLADQQILGSIESPCFNK